MPAPQLALFRDAAVRRAAGAIALLFGVQALPAQSSNDGFIPNPNNIVRAVLQQPDGKVIIAGDFTTVVPTGGTTTTRNRLARFNLNGTLDTTFAPSINNGQIHALALQADGKVLIGGTFAGVNSVGTATRNRMARLDATTGAPDTLDPNVTGTVRSIVVQSDGFILVGGDFNGAASIAGVARNRIARISSAGVADTLNPNAGAAVNVILLESDGRILVGGDFTGTFGGLTRNRLARLDATGAVDAVFNPGATGSVWTLAVAADGRILVGGDFNGAASIGGQARNRLARLDPVSGAADAYNPGATGTVRSFALLPDGRLVVGGGFNGAASIGGQARNRLARLDPNTGAADAFDPNANTGNVLAVAALADGRVLAGGEFGSLTPNGAGTVVTRSRFARLEREGWVEGTYGNPAISAGTGIFAVAQQPDGKILLGGDFTSGGRTNLLRLHANSALDAAFNPAPNGRVGAVAVLSDGSVVVGGAFTSAGGQTRNRLAKLDAATGSAVLAFDANANGPVLALAVDASGRILVGGNFTVIGGANRNRIARLDPATGLADAFDPNANGEVASIALRPDGRIFLGGNYSGVGGQPRLRLAQLDPVTGLADSFNPSANGVVQALAYLPGGKLLVSGFFSVCGGQARDVMASIDLATGLADGFNPRPNGVVYTMAVQADGKILIGGDFSVLGFTARDRLARLDPATGQPDAFNGAADSQVAGLALQPDGKILAVGVFGTIGGQTRIYSARLSNDIPALQNLSVTRVAATWQRSGSSPEFARVRFEWSADGLSYTPLGSGTYGPGGWIASALYLPGGQNLFVRATGFTATGNLSGSETREVSTRQVLLPVDQDLRIVTAERSGADDLAVTFAGALAGTSYRLERKLEMTDAAWDPVAGVPDLAATLNAPLQFVAPGQYGVLAKAFFRVRSLP